MRYMCLIKMNEDVGPAPVAVHEAIGAAMATAFANGSMVDAGGLFAGAEHRDPRRPGQGHHRRRAVRRSQGGGRGYAVINAATHAEAVAGAQVVIDVHVDHWPGWAGSLEIRPITEPSEDMPTD